MCKITKTAGCFPEKITTNMVKCIESVETLLEVASEPELIFLYRSFRYEEIVTGTMIIAHDKIAYGGLAPTPQSVLSDADASIKILEIQLDDGTMPSGPGTVFIKELAVAAEKLRMAIESGDEVDMKLEQSSTQAVINRIIEVVNTAINAVKGKKL